MTIHSAVSIVPCIKTSLPRCIGSVTINITAGEPANTSRSAFRQAQRPARRNIKDSGSNIQSLKLPK